MAAIAERDYLVARSYRLTLALEVLYGVLSLAIYFFISETVGEVPASELQSAPSYFAFAAVGAILGVVVAAATTGIAQRIREEQLTGTLEVLVAHPLTASEICVGFVAFPYLFALVKATLYLAIAAAWMELDVSQTSWLGLLIVLLASAFALAILGVLAGALVLAFKRGNVVTGVGVLAMALVSGSVFPVSVLPGWLQPLSDLLPLRYALDGVRAALFEGDGWEDDALVLMAFGAVGVPIALWVFAWALRFVERRGSLGEY